MAWIDDIQKLERLEAILNHLLQIKGDMPIVQARNIVNTVIDDYKSYLKVKEPNTSDGEDILNNSKKGPSHDHTDR